MSNFTAEVFVTPEVVVTQEAMINDPLTELLRGGVKNVIAQAVVRNGYLPARTI